MYQELSQSYGPIEELHVCDNLNDHMIGNVYVKFEDEEDEYVFPIDEDEEDPDEEYEAYWDDDAEDDRK